MKANQTMTRELALECMAYRDKNKCSWHEVRKHFDLPITTESLLSYCSKVRLGYVKDQPTERVYTKKRKPTDDEAYKQKGWDILSRPLAKGGMR